MCVRVCVFACACVRVCVLCLDEGVSLSDLCSAVTVWRRRKRKKKKVKPCRPAQRCLPACLYFPWLVTLLRLMNSERDLPASIGSSQLAANGGVVRAGKQQSPAPVSGGWVGVWLAGCGSGDSPRHCRATRVHASAQKATDSIVILWVVLSVFIVKINKLINK